MKTKIKQITLLDGKQLFYPTDDEYRKLSDQIESVIVEELMTKEEWNLKYFGIQMDDNFKQSVVDTFLMMDKHDD